MPIESQRPGLVLNPNINLGATEWTFMWIVTLEREGPCARQRIPFPSAPDSKFDGVKMSKPGIPY